MLCATFCASSVFLLPEHKVFQEHPVTTARELARATLLSIDDSNVT
jgi:hypothetical protein